jgi:AcrR family transcriptional regulator
MVTVAEPRPSLTRERILQAALAFADTRGVGSLTMRKLGDELGFEAMSLYHYVSSKSDLLDGILDLVLDEAEPPATALTWASGVRTSALSVNQALRRHPWAGALLMSAAGLRPRRLKYMDSLLGRLREAGFPADAAYHAYHVLDGFIFGFSLWQTTHTYTDDEVAHMAAAFATAISADAYPHLAEHGTQHFEPGPVHDVDAFEVGLDLVLDGLTKNLAAVTQSPS